MHPAADPVEPREHDVVDHQREGEGGERKVEPTEPQGSGSATRAPRTTVGYGGPDEQSAERIGTLKRVGQLAGGERAHGGEGGLAERDLAAHPVNTVTDRKIAPNVTPSVMVETQKPARRMVCTPEESELQETAISPRRDHGDVDAVGQLATSALGAADDPGQRVGASRVRGRRRTAPRGGRARGTAGRARSAGQQALGVGKVAG